MAGSVSVSAARLTDFLSIQGSSQTFEVPYACLMRAR